MTNWRQVLTRSDEEKSLTGCRKDTRWDRIRKRHTTIHGASGNAIRSEAVRRLLEMDFIGGQKQQLIEGGATSIQDLNPALVMDIRHKMFRNSPHKRQSSKAVHTRNIESCVAHNLEVERRYISHELSKYRQQLQNQHARNKISFKMPNMEEKRKEMSLLEHFPAHLDFDNENLERSLHVSAEHISDFYTAPQEALEQVRQMCTIASVECDDEIAIVDSGDQSRFNTVPRTPSPLTTTDELLRPMRETAEIEKQRSVRFETTVEVHQFTNVKSVSTSSSASSLESNTSDGIDSVISDLAGEALLELQMEAEEGSDPPAACQLCTHQVEPLELSVHNEREEEMHTHTIMEPISQLIVCGQSSVLEQRTSMKPAMYEVDDDDEGDERTGSDTNESVSNQEQTTIIAQLFQSRAHTNAVTLRRYFQKWIHYTTFARIEREDCRVGDLVSRAQNNHSDRVHLINTFLDKMRREKGRQRKQSQNAVKECEQVTVGGGGIVMVGKGNQPLVAKRFRNKIKVQQDIIDLQRLKLERQERVIMELKLNKLSEEARAARQELKDELKSVIRCGDAKSKAKARCLQLIGNLRDTAVDGDDEMTGRLQARGALLVPKFLQQMQERALERSVRHEQARQRRLRQEAEREAVKMAAEEAKRLEDEEAKQQRIEALREKRRQEKMFKVLQERERLRALENRRKAMEFWRHMMLRRIGMEGFRRLIQRKRDNQRKCEAFRRVRYKIKHFEAWREYWEMLQERKRTRADDVYFRRLKEMALGNWRNFVQQARNQYYVAVDWHELKLTERIFGRWLGLTLRMLMIEETKMRQATAHHEWHLKWKVLDCWQRLPQILQLEKDTEERRQRWRMKIWELLPDYTPNRDDLLWD